jgi:hypothetical protein
MAVYQRSTLSSLMPGRGPLEDRSAGEGAVGWLDFDDAIKASLTARMCNRSESSGHSTIKG